MKVIGFLLLVYLFFAALGVFLALAALGIAYVILRFCWRLIAPSTTPTRR